LLAAGVLQTQTVSQPLFPIIHEGVGFFSLEVPQRIELVFNLTASPPLKFTLHQDRAEMPAIRVE